jgi:hypothetical protein
LADYGYPCKECEQELECICSCELLLIHKRDLKRRKKLVRKAREEDAIFEELEEQREARGCTTDFF